MVRLKFLRRKAKLTQKDFAKRMNISQSTICSWENNKSVPRVGALPKIAEVLGCSIQDLFPEPAQFVRGS